MAATLRLWRQMENMTSAIDAYSIYFNNNPAKFHLNPIWNEAALGFQEQDEWWYEISSWCKIVTETQSLTEEVSNVTHIPVTHVTYHRQKTQYK